MTLLDLRDIVPFTPSDNNETDTVINGVHFNLTALRLFNYSVYENNTISNASKCYLIFDKFKPSMFDNGSWVNATTCYTPYYGIQGRGKGSIAFACAFGLTIMFTLINLRKHGKRYLREDKRFRVVGRRWQWYWMLFVAACGMISTLTGVDVERYYLQQIPIVLQSFFFMLMIPGALAMVWEAARHWGSWQERQIVDRDRTALLQDDRRSKVEFYLPLVFYLFAWLNFFMVIPRSWTAIQKQNTDYQKEYIAKPAATNTRNKAGSVIALVAWLVICASLWHSLKHYKQRPAGLLGKITAFCRDCPTKLFLAIILLLVRIGYGIASAWIWDLSIFKDDVQLGWPLGLGYGPILAILIVFEVSGFMEENEDKRIIEQRMARGAIADAELGIIHKPNWWSRNWAARYQTDEQRLKEMTKETGSGQRRPRRADQNIEMGNMNIRNRSTSRPAEDPFRDQSPEARQSSVAVGSRLSPRRADSDADSTMTGQTLTGNPQKIRSMLDV